MKGKMITTYYDQHLGRIWQEQDLSEFMDEKSSGKIKESNVICLYPAFTFQRIEGYGCAMTESACFLLSKMTPEIRKAALECWFGEKGVNANLIRMHIDSCDYSLSQYQAIVNPAQDFSLKNFRIKRDHIFMIPVVKETMELTGEDLEVLLSPWSPPAEWKTKPEMTENDMAVYGGMLEGVDFSKPSRCFGGRLKPEYYEAWAKYLVAYIKAYLKEGIPVTMLSIQNEAGAATNWDSCVWSGAQEKKFLKDYLYPAVKKAGLAGTIGIFVWDHNKERMIEHVEEVVDEETKDMIKGFAYHWYTGDHFDVLSMLNTKYPEKVLMHSESCGLHIPGKPLPCEITEEMKKNLPPEMMIAVNRSSGEIEYDDAMSYAHDMIGDINHGMNRWIDWNMIVDRTGGPRHVPGGFAAPIVAEDDGTFTKTLSYYYIKQIATTIRPEAVRIGSSIYGAGIEVTAAKNSDGSIGIVLLNRMEKDITVTMRLNGYCSNIKLSGKTLNSLLVEEPVYVQLQKGE